MPENALINPSFKKKKKSRRNPPLEKPPPTRADLNYSFVT